MTLRKFNTLYEFYKDNYDFQLTKVKYSEIEARMKKAMDGELIPD